MNKDINTLIKNSKNIAIFSHIEPDADALCSAFAMKNILQLNIQPKKKQNIDVFIDGAIGKLYDPIFKEEKLSTKVRTKYDVVFVLDCPYTQRTGRFDTIVNKSPIIINIDHHETNTMFGTQNYVDKKASSTCEILYSLIKKFKLKINDLIAKELYQGIITDTNCFASVYCTKKTHRYISELMNFNFDSSKVKEYYFRNNSRAKTKLLSKALQSMKFYNDDRLTTMKINNEIYSKVCASFQDTLGIIDNGINIHGIEVGAILIETFHGHIYCSLRSKGNINVGDIADKFGGGGSIKLAAFQIDGDIKEIEQKLVATISPLLHELEDDKEIIFD